MNIYNKLLTISCLVPALLHAQQQPAEAWLTDPAHNVFFVQQAPARAGASSASLPSIVVDASKKMQTIDGFGFALTGGSAGHFMGMSAPARAQLLKELFGRGKGSIGTSYLRISIGASDLNDHAFSYDDMPAGQTDVALSHFDLGPDKKTVIPVLKQILAINPNIKILGSPWSPPAWMKNNHDTRGGSLLPEYYQAYANYFVRYIRSMQGLGIRIDAITVQNEPLHPGNNPSMLMPAEEERDFVKAALGPAFKKAGIKTKIIVYDHNCDRPDYPLTILNDPEARKYVDGSAFHLYGGTIDTLTSVHNAYPDKNLYFTEQWVGGPGNMKRDIAEHVEKLIIGATRNWCRNVIEWNISSDPHYQPHTDRGGCDRCLGGVTIDGDKVTRNPGYYIVAHAAKFVTPGSVRIASNVPEGLPNVAFRTQQGKTVLIVLNMSNEQQRFMAGGHVAELNAGAVATYIW